MDDVDEISADVIALMNVYVQLISKQNEIIEALKAQVRELQGGSQLTLADNHITAYPLER